MACISSKGHKSQLKESPVNKAGAIGSNKVALGYKQSIKINIHVSITDINK